MYFTTYSIILIILIILVAHYIAPKEYNWKTNTISELAAQTYKYRMIMRIGFIGFGVLLSVSIFLIWFFESFQVKYIPIMIYSLSVLLSGIFSTAPFNNDKDFSARESKFHSFFAQLAGISFSFGILMFFFYTESILLKIAHFSYLLFVLITSLLFGKISRYRGVIQRILYLGSFLWIILFIR